MFTGQFYFLTNFETFTGLTDNLNLNHYLKNVLFVSHRKHWSLQSYFFHNV